MQGFNLPTIRSRISQINKDSSICKKALEDHLRMSEHFYDFASMFYLKLLDFKTKVELISGDQQNKK